MGGAKLLDDYLKKILTKRAKGYLVKEVTSDFSLQDGEMVEVKRKISKKYVPPDVSAIKIMMEEKSFDNMTDEELEAEKNRLLDELQKKEGDIDDKN